MKYPELHSQAWVDMHQERSAVLRDVEFESKRQSLLSNRIGRQRRAIEQAIKDKGLGDFFTGALLR